MCRAVGSLWDGLLPHNLILWRSIGIASWTHSSLCAQLSSSSTIRPQKDIWLIPVSITIKAAGNIRVQSWCECTFLFLWDQCPRTQLPDSVGVSRKLEELEEFKKVGRVGRNCPTVFQSDCIILLCPPARRGRARFSTWSPAFEGVTLLFTFAIRGGSRLSLWF